MQKKGWSAMSKIASVYGREVLDSRAKAKSKAHA